MPVACLLLTRFVALALAMAVASPHAAAATDRGAPLGAAPARGGGIHLVQVEAPEDKPDTETPNDDAAPPASRSRPRARLAASCERSHAEDVVRSLAPNGEFALASGRTVKLLDLRLPADGAAWERAAMWLRSLAGRRVNVAAVGSADRWGRVAADLALRDGDAPTAGGAPSDGDAPTGPAASIDVADLLVGEGFALVDAGERDVLCRPDLLVREAQARSRGLGLWGEARFNPIRADDMERLRALIGQFALVEGRVRSVGERRERTYLNFGPDWKSDLTLTIPKRSWAILQERGLSAASLRGARVRARGVLEEWQGVALEIIAADMLEVLGQDHGPRRTRP